MMNQIYDELPSSISQLNETHDQMVFLFLILLLFLLLFLILFLILYLFLFCFILVEINL